MIIHYCLCREFTYCHSLTGTKYHSIDQFRRVQPKHQYWDSSATCITHFSQNKLEGLLLDEVQRYLGGPAPPLGTAAAALPAEGSSFFYRGYAAVGHSYSAEDDIIKLTIRAAADSSSSSSSSLPSSSQLRTPDLTVRCRYVIAADGANSYLRDSLGIKLIGRSAHRMTIFMYNAYMMSRPFLQLLR